MKYQKDQTRRMAHSRNLLFILAAIAVFILSPQTSFAVGCSTVDFSAVFKSTLSPAPNPSSGNDIVEADFNRDGNLDFAVTNVNGGTANVFLGNGKGGFSVSTLTTTSFPINIFARDFNLDGKIDLLVSGSGSVILFNGNGTGGFTLGGTITSGGGFTVAVADFNLDGKEDFVSQNNFNLETFLGNGNGTFAAPTLTPQPNSVATAVAADFNRDGKPDVAMTGFTNSQVYFLPGNGSGGFGAIVPFDVSFSSNRFLTPADLNGDGRLDLIVGGNTFVARVLTGAASGVFTVSGTITGSGSSSIRNIQTGDLNDDGKVDLLMFRDGAVEVRLGNGDGTFVAPTVSAIDAQNTDNLTAADFNNDGKIDFAATDANEAFVALNRCGGLTSKPKIDFDGDGQTDIAFFRPSVGHWFVLRSTDNSFFAFPFGSNGDIPAAGDYDGDLKSDAAVFRPSSATWFILLSAGGTTILQFGANGDQPVPADYDGDGKSDVAIYRPSVGEWWYTRSSNGVTAALQFGTTGDIPIR